MSVTEKRTYDTESEAGAGGCRAASNGGGRSMSEIGLFGRCRGGYYTQGIVGNPYVYLQILGCQQGYQARTDNFARHPAFVDENVLPL